MEANLYDERFLTRKIEKLRALTDCADPESVNYIPDKELGQHVVQATFYLGDIQSWETFKDPFDKFNPKPTTWMAVYFYNDESHIILEEFSKFDQMMVEFISKRNNVPTNTESI